MDDPLRKRVGGALCLDFVNTVHGRVGRPGAQRARDYADAIVGERLSGYEALLRWAAFGDLLTPREVAALSAKAAAAPAAAARVLNRARVLREALYRAFKSAIEGWVPEAADVAAINGELARARSRERLAASPRWRWQPHRPGATLDGMLAPVVRSAADLLTGPALDRVGQCPGEDCGWLFLDTSRSRRRQWCDMADCGNLAKVHRFRMKQRR